MSIEKAKNHFLGKAGCKRLNCAEAILKAFNELDPSEQESICKGGGRSPNNECGALCAAKSILREYDPEKVGELEVKFIEAAGSSKCDEIRKLKKLSCVGCVEKAARLLHERLIFQKMIDQSAA